MICFQIQNYQDKREGKNCLRKKAFKIFKIKINHLRKLINIMFKETRKKKIKILIIAKQKVIIEESREIK